MLIILIRLMIKLNDAYMNIVFWQGFECPNDVILDPRDLRWERDWVDYDLWWPRCDGTASCGSYCRLTGCQSMVDICCLYLFVDGRRCRATDWYGTSRRPLVTMWDGYVLNYHMNCKLMAHVSDWTNVVDKACMLVYYRHVYIYSYCVLP